MDKAGPRAPSDRVLVFTAPDVSTGRDQAGFLWAARWRRTYWQRAAGLPLAMLPADEM